MSSNHKDIDPRSGQVVLIFAVAVLPVMAVLLTLMVDAGNMAQAKAHLQNGSDAAALAAAQVLIHSRVDGSDEQTARSLAQGECGVLHGDNCPGTLMELEFGKIDENGNFVALDDSEHATAVRTVFGQTDQSDGGALDLMFGGMIGSSQVDVTAEATASLFANIQGAHGVMPFAVPESRIGQLGEEITFYPEEDLPPGAFGLLNLDGGSLGTTEIVEAIENGGGELIFNSDSEGLWVQATTGIRSAIESSIRNNLLGESVVMIIYDDARGTGSGTEFHIKGFLAATITDINIVGASDHSYLRCRVDNVTDASSVEAELYLGPGGEPSPNLVKVALWK